MDSSSSSNSHKLKGPLVSYASQPDIRTSLPRSILVVLGIIPQDSQTASQAPTTLLKLSHRQSQAQSKPHSKAESQTGDTSNSEKEVAAEEPKESADMYQTWRLKVTQMTPRRRYGYVRLYLYLTKKDFYENEGKFFAILIRKRDIRVVGVQLDSREI
nr:HEAT repeat-containing protein [Tanacetum cinerariifolium]